jgi:hypothetical protein
MEQRAQGVENVLRDAVAKPSPRRERSQRRGNEDPLPPINRDRFNRIQVSDRARNQARRTYLAPLATAYDKTLPPILHSVSVAAT